MVRTKVRAGKKLMTEASERTLDTTNPIADMCVRFLCFAANQERAAIERGERYQREAVERLFAEAFWPTPRVVLWIAFRDPAVIDERVPSVRRARWYKPSKFVVPHPEQELLNALHAGRILAVDQGERLPREAWAAAKARSLPVVMFDQIEILNAWPTVAEKDAANAWETTTAVAGVLAPSDEKFASRTGDAEIDISLENRVAQLERRHLKPKNTGGRPPIYDWPPLVPLLKEHVRQKGKFSLQTELIEWCCDNVFSEESPADKTVREAIKKYKLDEIGLRGNRGPGKRGK
jgi:hypothetical protein